MKDVTDIESVREAVKLSGIEITELVSGSSPTIDKLGKKWAEENQIPIRLFVADWHDISHPDALIKSVPTGKSWDARSGFRRDRLIFEYAEALIAVWDGYGRAIKDTIRRAKKHGLRVFILGKLKSEMEQQPDWWTIAIARQKLPNKKLLNDKQWVTLQWHWAQNKRSYQACKNVIIALCACGDFKFLRDPTERFRASCANCKNSADIDALVAQILLADS